MGGKVKKKTETSVLAMRQLDWVQPTRNQTIWGMALPFRAGTRRNSMQRLGLVALNRFSAAQGAENA
ncbi:hypothetical protein [Kinneretia aquatilis]|uniref:hypothetical protein n=1 Tax=Kinneretia aquatilis TaxID=2070761 RepID=UPI0014953058|nr:hypothetical protein [Paucibacter aquatile]WIV98673.1 hypothetical protein K9V56_004020 [Paucibacter aquatile]